MSSPGIFNESALADSRRRAPSPQFPRDCNLTMNAPQMSRWMWANSLLVCAAFLFLAGVFAAGFVHWDVRFVVMAILGTGPCMALAILQYLAAIHRRQSEAKILAFALAGLGLIIFFGAAANLCESLSSVGLAATAARMGSDLLIVNGLAVWFAITGWLNYQWNKRLTEHARHAAAIAGSQAMDPQPGAPDARGHKGVRFTLAHLLIWMTGLSTFFAGVRAGLNATPPQQQHHLTAAQANLDLPSAASDVCIFRGPRGSLFFDFAIDEEAFKQWAHDKCNSEGFTLTEITQGALAEFYLPTSKSSETVRITRGWMLDLGHYVKYHYDADTGRAYSFRY